MDSQTLALDFATDLETSMLSINPLDALEPAGLPDVLEAMDQADRDHQASRAAPVAPATTTVAPATTVASAPAKHLRKVLPVAAANVDEDNVAKAVAADEDDDDDVKITKRNKRKRHHHPSDSDNEMDEDDRAAAASGTAPPPPPPSITVPAATASAPAPRSAKSPAAAAAMTAEATAVSVDQIPENTEMLIRVGSAEVLQRLCEIIRGITDKAPFQVVVGGNGGGAASFAGLAIDTMSADKSAMLSARYAVEVLKRPVSENNRPFFCLNLDSISTEVWRLLPPEIPLLVVRYKGQDAIHLISAETPESDPVVDIEVPTIHQDDNDDLMTLENVDSTLLLSMSLALMRKMITAANNANASAITIEMLEGTPNSIYTRFSFQGEASTCKLTRTFHSETDIKMAADGKTKTITFNMKESAAASCSGGGETGKASSKHGPLHSLYRESFSTSVLAYCIRGMKGMERCALRIRLSEERPMIIECPLVDAKDGASQSYVRFAIAALLPEATTS